MSAHFDHVTGLGNPRTAPPARKGTALCLKLTNTEKVYKFNKTADSTVPVQTILSLNSGAQMFVS